MLLALMASGESSRGIFQEKKKKNESCFETQSDCACVCVCVVRALPLLTRVRCGHSISQLLKRIDAAVFFGFDSQHFLFQNTSAPPEEGFHFALLHLSTSQGCSGGDPAPPRLQPVCVTSPLTHICVRLRDALTSSLPVVCSNSSQTQQPPLPLLTLTCFFWNLVQQLTPKAVCEMQTGDVAEMKTAMTRFFNSSI